MIVSLVTFFIVSSVVIMVFLGMRRQLESLPKVAAREIAHYRNLVEKYKAELDKSVRNETNARMGLEYRDLTIDRYEDLLRQCVLLLDDEEHGSFIEEINKKIGRNV